MKKNKQLLLEIIVLIERRKIDRLFFGNIIDVPVISDLDHDDLIAAAGEFSLSKYRRKALNRILR